MRLGRTGLGHRPHCSASRLRSGSLTRLRSATKRSNQPQIPQGEIRNTLTNLFQDLTVKLRSTHEYAVSCRRVLR